MVGIRYLSIPIQTRRLPVPRKTEQKFQRSPLVCRSSINSFKTEPVMIRMSLTQIMMYLNDSQVLATAGLSM